MIFFGGVGGHDWIRPDTVTTLFCCTDSGEDLVTLTQATPAPHINSAGSPRYKFINTCDEAKNGQAKNCLFIDRGGVQFGVSLVVSRLF